MRRLAAISVALALAMVAVTAVVLTGQARSDGSPYTVRAIFDDASFAVTGENVRIAGANVGTITALGVTPQKRAAVTITISDSRFTPFFSNAHCEIRPQSLIGEEYVNCTPGTSSARQLRRIQRGPGAGDYLLPVTRTSSPIDTDIVQNISTEPVRESLAVIIGELGTGLAARGLGTERGHPPRQSRRSGTPRRCCGSSPGRTARSPISPRTPTRCSARWRASAAISPAS